MEKKKCWQCRYVEKNGLTCFCLYSQITGRTRTAQLYKRLGIKAATKESARLLSGYHCPFFEKGEKLGMPRQQISLRGTPRTPRPEPEPRKKQEKRGRALQYDWEGVALPLLQQGASIPRIAEALGCRTAAVSHWKCRNGLSRPENYAFDYEGEGAKLWEAGASIREIAKALGCSPSAVQHWCRRTGRWRAGPNGARAAPPS